MTLTQEQRKELIPQLDHYHKQAQRLQREMDALLYPIHNEPMLQLSQVRAGDLTITLQETCDALKRANGELIVAYVTGWHHFRLDDDEDSEKEEPVYESVRYDGGDVWSVTITTPTHGRERVVVHLDAASWHSVYSADPA